ncbi:MAG: hypothetical protein RI907_3799 [Pseudomonadota bacterium]|jgi:EAL and modified HD-GYP domain-containing signal transduction protein
MSHPILSQIALAYCPVIDRNRTVTATRLTVFPQHADASLDANQLLQALADTWPVGGPQLWMKVAQESLLVAVMQSQPSSHIAIEVPAFMAMQPQYGDVLSTLHANGNPLLLNGRPLSDLPKALLPAFGHAIIDLSDDHRLDESSGGAGVGQSGTPRQIGFVQSGVRSVADMETSFRRGATAVLGWPIDDAIKVGNKPADQPALQVIVLLIDQLHRQEDIEVLENTLKRDPPLAYKLMRYINSPAFGLSVEISSFRHAIMILGYQRLKRWLALLLATASKDPNMRPVMFAAVRRGLLMEELAKLSGSEEMRNELFICGVFSLLDRMFQQPFSELLKTIPVPESVYQALVDHDGPYAPYFRLVEAIEGQSAFEIRDALEPLMITMGDVNACLLQALSNAAQLD